MFRSMNSFLFVAGAAGLFCADLLAGGFFLTLGNPVASHDLKAKHAVLLVRPDGCQNPVTAKVLGSAEGIVDGQRRSIPLDLVTLSTPGTYAVMRQWPSEGAWVLRLTATFNERTTSALVPVTRDGFDRGQAKWYPHDAPDSDLEAMLRNANVPQVAAKQ